jgi:hypothetical protein
MGLVYMLRGGASLWVLLAVAVLVAVLILLVLVIPRASSTGTDHEHLTVQRPFRTRKIEWRDIQAIETNRHWNGGESVIVYDADGRRIKLPHVNSWSVPAFQPAVANLRRIWTRYRGDDWALDPELFDN